MNEVNKTLYIPLYGKSYVSQKGIILNDKRAEEIWAKEGFSLKGRSKSKWLAYYMGMRSRVFDDWVVEQIEDKENATVIHIGCGLDSRIERVGAEASLWYDVDFPEVIAERKKYFSETDSYRMLGADVSRGGWLNAIPEAKNAIVVMEGVSMYLSPDQLSLLMRELCAHFERISLLADFYTTFAAKASKIKNPINDVGVTQVYGIDDPRSVEVDNLVFVWEYEMTPARLIDELSGMEKRLFKSLYGGKMSKRLYKLYEYIKA